MKEYELPISPNYVGNWGIKEAIRELLQNAIDSDKCGYSKRILYIKDENELVITNFGTKLPMSSLVLGCSSKADIDGMIGKYGEGYKLALVVLIRKGFSVSVLNDDETWSVCFENSDKFETQVLKIKATKLKEKAGEVSFYIKGISQDIYEQLLKDFPCITGDYGNFVDTDYGQILLDAKFSGKAFVSGLFIQEDSNFKYGYNFNSDVVELDRDRKAINYYELRKLTASSFVTAEKCSPELFKAISSSYRDTADIIDVINNADDNFLSEYRDMFYDKNSLEENTLVATKAVMKQLKQMDVSAPIVEGSEIESYLIAKANDNLGLIYSAKEIVEKKSNIDSKWEDIEQSDWFELKCWVQKYKKNIPKQGLAEIDDILEQMTPYGYNCIEKYIPENFEWSLENFNLLKQENENRI